jgi:hypothetical protein
VVANLTFRKCWQNKEVIGIITNANASNKLTVVNLGGSGGFVEGCELVYKAGKATGDYHGQINSNNFEKLVNEKVIPNLATPSLIVLDNAPYHGKQVYKPPTKSSLKKDMLEYLRRHSTAGDISLTRLQELVQKGLKGVTK